VAAKRNNARENIMTERGEEFIAKIFFKSVGGVLRIDFLYYRSTALKTRC
jgi:hypothetical protein